MSHCRTCGAPVLWARTEKGKRMPLDLKPYTGPEPAGLFVLRERELNAPLALAIPRAAFPDEPVYRSHFATCPNAAAHRKPRTEGGTR